MDRDQLIYYGYRALGMLASVVPPRLGYWVAERCAALAYRLQRPSAAGLRENLSHVLGVEADHPAVESAAEGVFRNLAKNYFDLFHNHALTDREVLESVTLNGFPHLLEALEEGSGIVLTSAHFGVFDGFWAVAQGYNLKITAAAEHLKPERLFEYMCKLRASDFVTFLPVDRPLLGLVRALRRGEIAVVAADRDITRSGVLVDFFGSPARLPDGPVQLALRTGAQLMICFALRQQDNSAAVHVEPPLQLERTGDFAVDVQVNVRKVTARLEEWIRRYPDQWLVLEPIWRNGQRGS